MFLSGDGQTIECQGSWPNTCHFKKPPSENDFHPYFQKPLRSTLPDPQKVEKMKDSTVPEIFYSPQSPNKNPLIFSTPPSYSTKPSWFLRYINFDLYGPEHKNCSGHKANYSFKGSYYYMYLKIKSCHNSQGARCTSFVFFL